MSDEHKINLDDELSDGGKINLDEDLSMFDIGEIGEEESRDELFTELTDVAKQAGASVKKRAADKIKEKKIEKSKTDITKLVILGLALMIILSIVFFVSGIDKKKKKNTPPSAVRTSEFQSAPTQNNYVGANNYNSNDINTNQNPNMPIQKGFESNPM